MNRKRVFNQRLLNSAYSSFPLPFGIHIFVPPPTSIHLFLYLYLSLLFPPVVTPSGGKRRESRRKTEERSNPFGGPLFPLFLSRAWAPSGAHFFQAPIGNPVGGPLSTEGFSKPFHQPSAISRAWAPSGACGPPTGAHYYGGKMNTLSPYGGKQGKQLGPFGGPLVKGGFHLSLSPLRGETGGKR